MGVNLPTIQSESMKHCLRQTGSLDGLHLSISIDDGVQLATQHRRLRRIEGTLMRALSHDIGYLQPSLQKRTSTGGVTNPLDIPLDDKAQLQSHTDAHRLMSVQALGNQLRVLGLEIHRFPVPAQMVLDGIHDRDECLDDFLRLHLVGVVLERPANEEGSREVANRVDDGLQPGPPAPVALVGRRVAEDEHQPDDDR